MSEPVNPAEMRLALQQRGVEPEQVEWMVFCATEHAFPREATLSDVRAEYERWPLRLSELEHDIAAEGEWERIVFSVKRTDARGEDSVYKAQLAYKLSEPVEAIARAAASFYAEQVRELRRIGDPRWDDLIERERATGIHPHVYGVD